MFQISRTYHTLQIKDGRSAYHLAIAGMYQPARALAHQGIFEAALQKAADIHIENYGQMHGVSFRVVTNTVMVSTFGGAEDAGKEFPT